MADTVIQSDDPEDVGWVLSSVISNYSVARIWKILRIESLTFEFIIAPLS